MIDRPDLGDENLTVDVPTWNANIPRIFEAVAEWAKDKTVAEIVELGQLLRVAVTPGPRRRRRARRRAARGPRLVGARGRRRLPRPALQALGHAVGPARARRRPSARTRARRRPRRPASTAGDGAATRRARRSRACGSSRSRPTGPARSPAGSSPTSAPTASRSSGRRARPRGRCSGSGPYQDLQRQPHHRAMYFYEMNRNKRGVCIDLAKPDGRAAFLELVKSADVVLENNSARVMPNLGLGYDDLRAVNPSIIMVSMSGYGGDGPHRDWVAYGANIETTSSLTSITGYPDGQLSRTTLFYADPVSGQLRRGGHHGGAAPPGPDRRGPVDRHVAQRVRRDVLRRRAASSTSAPASCGRRWPTATRAWRRRACTAASAPTTGSPSPCARATSGRQVAELIGRPDLAADESLADLAARHARHDELDAAISAWTAGLEQYEVAEALQARGVPAGPVLANWQILPDPHIHERGMYETIVFPVVGAYPTTTWPWRFERTPARLARPAPLFAEHNREILDEAGLDDDAIDALYERHDRRRPHRSLIGVTVQGDGASVPGVGADASAPTIRTEGASRTS